MKNSEITDNNGSRLFLYIQYGSGYLSNPTEWINFDASPNLYLQRIPIIGNIFQKISQPVFPGNIIFGDIVKKLPILENSCDGIYCSHVLEHLCLDDFRIALNHTYQYLKPNAVFRFVMPDLSYYVDQYIKSNNEQSSINFLSKSGLGEISRTRSITKFIREYFGNSRHFWLWDYKATKFELEKIGFRNVRLATFNDSTDRKFCEIEDVSRWENCMGIECQK